MALVGNISGSQQSNSLIAVSGTVIVANRPDALFPSQLPGTDVSFFVSGSLGGKGAEERTVSLFGGDAVISGSLTIGTGSLQITSNDIQFSSFANRIELVGNDIKFFDGNNTNGITLQGLAAASAGGNPTEVQYNSGGSLAGSSTFTFNSSENRLTVSQAAIPTALTASTLKAGGSSVSLFDDTATTINFGAGASSALNIGPMAGVTTISGDLKVAGNDIKSSGDNTAITLTAEGNVIIPGDLTVNGTTITADVSHVTVEDPVMALGFTSGSVAVTAADRGWIGGISGGDNVAMIWDNSAAEFVVGRTTESGTDSDVSLSSYSSFHAGNILGNIVTASLGFSGSHTTLVDGTSAFVAGSGIQITSASNGAVTITSTAVTAPAGSDTQIQFNDAGSFGGDAELTYNKTTDTLTGVTASFYRVLVSDVGTVNGAVTLGDAPSDTVTINGTTTFAGAGVSTVFEGDIAVNGGDITTSAATFNLVNTGATQVNFAGGASSGTTIGHATGGVTLNGTATVTGDLAVNGPTSADITTTTGAATLFNSTAASVNIGGAATTMLVGASNVVVGIGGVSPSNSTITASTGSFGRVVSTGIGTSTFTGTVSTGGLAVNGNANFSGGNASFASNANIIAQGTGNQMNSLTVSGSNGFYVTTGPTGISGSIVLGDVAQSPSDTITLYGTVSSNILPTSDRLYNLGSPSARWANVYTGDLHLRNERGNWTVIEEESYLSIRNNQTGKMYKFVLEEIVDPTEV